MKHPEDTLKTTKTPSNTTKTPDTLPSKVPGVGTYDKKTTLTQKRVVGGVVRSCGSLSSELACILSTVLFVCFR